MRIRSMLFAGLLLGAPAFAAVQWRGDFETNDLSQFTKAQIVSPDRIQIVSDSVKQGAHAAKITVQQGDNPINASGNRNELVYDHPEAEGSESWYRWQTKFADDFPSENTWQLFMQWHQPEDCCGSPPIQFQVYGEELQFTLSTAETLVWKTPLVRGQWHDFMLHVRFSDDPSVGFVELWYDGQQVLQKTSAATRANDYLKTGLYRNANIAKTGVLYQDGLMKADSMQDLIDADTPKEVLAQPQTPPSLGGSPNAAPATAPSADPTGTTTAPLSAGAGSGGGGGGGCSAAGGSLFAAFGIAAMASVLRRRKRAVLSLRK